MVRTYIIGLNSSDWPGFGPQTPPLHCCSLSDIIGLQFTQGDRWCLLQPTPASGHRKEHVPLVAG